MIITFYLFEKKNMFSVINYVYTYVLNIFPTVCFIIFIGLIISSLLLSAISVNADINANNYSSNRFNDKTLKPVVQIYRLRKLSLRLLALNIIVGGLIILSHYN